MITDEQVEVALNAYQEIEYDACFDDSERCTQHAAIRKALEAAEQAAWQPIETAPRDGNFIMVAKLNSEYFVRQSAWSRINHEWVVDKNEYITVCLDFQPTHWRPLPELPKEK